MSEIKIGIRDKPPFTWTLPNEERHVFRICRFHADILEMEDLHFHLDSAVMLPERDPADADDPSSGAPLTGLSVLRACLAHAKANPSKKMLVTGHTDRSGAADYNKKLSNLRARNVRAILTGDADDWASACVDKHIVRDYQAILKWIANVRYWPDCDPGPVDGDHGSGTSRALRAFKKKFNDSYGGALGDDATVAAPTWKAFAKMYDVGLAGLLQTDDAGLAAYQKALTWFAPAWVGCGENHPITPDLAKNYRSAIDRRVEILFFDPGEEPQLGDCHPSADGCVPAQCELYRKPFLGGRCYVFRPIVVDTNAKVSLELTEIRGLYKPGHDDPGDVSAKTTKLAGYLKGYLSDDDQGRIFVNQIPRVDSSVSWEDVKKKNKQYVELSATIDVAEGTIPPDAQVVWEWSDPDDPSDADMRDDAAAIIDPKDFQNGVRGGEQGDDNQGTCDFPNPKAANEPAFEQIGPYTLTADSAGTKRCFTLISGGKSEVRFHCTDAGGDNFRLKATVRPAPGLVVTGGAQTGVMTMWKRIDVEHRRMPDAESIPAKDMAQFFEKQFVQMDVAEEELTSSNLPYINNDPDDDLDASFVDREFKNKGKPGWFFVCVAREDSAPIGKARHSLYEGPGRLVEESGSLVPPATNRLFDDRNLPRWESVVVDTLLTEQPLFVTFFEGGKKESYFAGDFVRNVPPGKSTIRLSAIDFQSDFEATDGSWRAAYAKRAFYFPRFRFRWPENVWERKGYGFPDDVYVSVVSRGAGVLAGVSPEVKDAAGLPYFAGRTVVFCRHPHFTKPGSAEIAVAATWSEGDDLSVTINGATASYKVTAHDVTVPANVTDAALFVSGQVGRGIEAAINNHAVLSLQVSAGASFGKVRIQSLASGSAGNGIKISASPAGLVLSGAELTGGGFDDEARRDIVQVFTHELGHAFGFPHKCGYHTFESTPDTSCTMNYFHSWLYVLATQSDPVARQVERFGPGKKGNNFCALHTRGIRLGRLEDNPAIWKW